MSETVQAKPTRKLYQMKVQGLRDLTSSVRELTLVSDQDFKFRCGQFVTLHVPQPEGKPALRAYSIASTEADLRGFKLLFKYVDQGKASEFVWSLRGGETLQFTGPFGRVFFQEPPTDQIVFLNTGTGLSQHLSYLESKGAQYHQVQFRMLFGVRSEADQYYIPELKALKKQFPNFSYEFVLSRPSSSWTGKKGYVQNFINEFDYLKTPTTFYLCGNGGMIKETKALLATHEFPSNRIWAEAFD
jgi:CDP-4-dehydro-6-deoxyglucose reductase, E3